MRRMLHLFAAGSLVAIGGLSGCGENGSVLFIQGVIMPEPPDCSFSPEASGTMLMSGTVDSALTTSYRAALLVGNQITRQGSRDQLRTETSRVSMVGAEVHVLDDGNNEIDRFTVPAHGQIDPGSSQEPGYGVVSTELLSPVAGLGSHVIVRVQVYGETLGGQDVESNWFRFPIRIVHGSLIAFPVGMTTCDPVEPLEDTTCWIGQDGLTPCTACPGVPECEGLPTSDGSADTGAGGDSGG